MNQKNMFTAISVVLILQGLGFFFMGDRIAVDAFPNVDASVQGAVKIMLEVMSALSIALGLIAYASRTHAGAVWAFTVGFAIFLCVTLKHLLVDGVNVPIPAVVIQTLIVLVCGYLWLGQSKRTVASAALGCCLLTETASLWGI
jgi:hypothetical protein